jgi:2-C-methyl-D-erythritol 4-phosphate cytidylyltransferase
MSRCAAIIVAAGSSRRMGFNKLLAPLAGEPVLLRTLRAFQACPQITEIILVAGDEVAATIEDGQVPKLTQKVAGGAERHSKRVSMPCQRHVTSSPSMTARGP